jgi:hypothetical protein
MGSFTPTNTVDNHNPSASNAYIRMLRGELWSVSLTQDLSASDTLDVGVSLPVDAGDVVL